MKTKDMVISSILLAIGFVLHTITPPIFGGIKPDFLLSCMFIALMVNSSTTNALATGVVAGLISALTTGFPGGELPNFIDKIITSILIMTLIKVVFKEQLNIYRVIILSLLGTFFSGLIFLTSANIIVGLPGPFGVLFLSAVPVAALLNTVCAVMIYKTFKYTLDMNFKRV